MSNMIKRLLDFRLADAGFHMICAHCDSPTFRIKPNAEMLCEGGIVMRKPQHDTSYVNNI